MKITKKQLRQIIKEEVSILSEKKVTSKEQLLNPLSDANKQYYKTAGIDYTPDSQLLIDWMESQKWDVRVNDDGTIFVKTPGFAFFISAGLI